ncbi:MAG: hypothetical protein PHO14_06445, partial [Kiritimatiellae bacterium]|nr:hypothetical protein [Kiritimatiellia bacterium]
SDYTAGACAPPRRRFAPPEAVPPAPPVGVTVSDFGLREVTLQWPPPADRSLYYRIERAAQPEGPFEAITTLAATRGSYADAGTRRKPLNDAATYYYRLVAIDRAELESAASPVLESMTAPPPVPPVDLAANAPSARAVSLEWTPPPSEGVTRYRVERADGGTDDFVDVGDVSSPTFSEGGTSASPLRDSSIYRYRVRSINRVGAVGDASAVVEVKTLPPPKPPTGLTAQSLGVRCVPLTWAIHPAPDIIRYAIYRADGAEGPFSRLDTVEGRATTTYLDGGHNPGSLEDDQPYFYRIRAINRVLAESAASEGAHATTRPPPPVVEGLTAITGLPRRVELSWRPSPDDAVIAYELERAEADGTFQFLARVEGLDATAYTDTGDDARRFLGIRDHTPLKDGTAYAYRIRAINTAEAASDWCEAIDAVTKIVPQPPTGLRVSTGHARVIDAAWNTNREKDIIAYVVEMAAIEEGPFTDAGRVPAEGQLHLTQDNLPPGLSRFYRVQAVDIDGLQSDWTEPEEGTTKPLPEAPTDVTVEWGADGAWVRWSPPPQDDIVHYRILNRRFMGQDELAVSEDAEYFFPMAELAKKKVMMITAVDADGLESSTSNVLEVKVPR